MDRLHNPYGIRDILTGFGFGDSHHGIVISALPIFEQTREDRRKLLREMPGMDECFIEAANNLGVSRVRLSSREKQGTDSVEDGLVRSG